MKKIALLIIDAQIDFMDLPGAALPVAGACADMDRVAAFIKTNMQEISSISCTLDSHRTIDISHPSWWATSDGKNVAPFTPISHQDLLDGKYTALFNPQWSFEYVKKLEEQGEFQHFIWPYHCLIGSEGASLYKPLHKVINEWEAQRRIPVKFVTKGDNPYTEHFGAFRANIEMKEDPKTQFNQDLVDTLMKYDDVYLAGEARSHCVVNSLRQAVNEVPALAPKIILLEDCMSDVPGLPAGFYQQVADIYADAVSKGVRISKSTNPLL